MKLPNAKRVLVEREKIADYLLNAAHPDNGGKARFFARLGFRRGEWETLAKALQKLAKETEVAETSETAHGRKYVIVGKLKSPSNKTATVLTVWIVDTGFDTPRLVTAYPSEG